MMASAFVPHTERTNDVMLSQSDLPKPLAILKHLEQHLLLPEEGGIRNPPVLNHQSMSNTLLDRQRQIQM